MPEKRNPSLIQLEKNIDYLMVKMEEVKDWKIAHEITSNIEGTILTKIDDKVFGTEGLVSEMKRLKTLEESRSKLISAFKWIVGVVLAFGPIIIAFLMWSMQKV